MELFKPTNIMIITACLGLLHFSAYREKIFAWSRLAPLLLLVPSLSSAGFPLAKKTVVLMKMMMMMMVVVVVMVGAERETIQWSKLGQWTSGKCLGVLFDGNWKDVDPAARGLGQRLRLVFCRSRSRAAVRPLARRSSRGINHPAPMQ